MAIVDSFTAAMAAAGRTERRPEDFPIGAPVRVRTFHHVDGELDIEAIAIGASSASHLRIRADDGLVFTVPASDCELIQEDGR